MSDQAREETKSKPQVKKHKSGYGGWLFRKKRAAVKSWSTVWRNPEVRKAIKAHNESIAKSKGA